MIKARDFNKNTTDPTRDTWTGATMAAVVEAAKGEVVMIETDNMTGHVSVGKLIGVIPSHGGYNFPQVLIEFSDGTRTSFLLFKCGNVVTTTDTPIKWDALKAYREQQGAAIAAGRAKIGKGREWGRWEAEPCIYPRTFNVVYTPHTGNPHYADKWGTRGHVRVTVPEDDGQDAAYFDERHGAAANAGLI
jgi:hypothetical protein